MRRSDLTAEGAEKQRAAASLKENDVSREVIGAAIDVHKELGPGLVEKIYEEALCHELHLRGLTFLRQSSVPISYEGVSLSRRFGSIFWSSKS